MLLGELLISEGVLTAAQVEEALAAQVINGGRLGTNLVELGHLTEAQLAGALGLQHGIHFASGDIVPSAEALGLLDLNYADDKDVLPARVEGNRLYLLVINPDDIDVRDYVAMRTGKRVVPVVIPEFRMAQLQRRYSKAFRPVREVDIEAMRRKRAGAETHKPEPAADLMGEEEFESLYAAAMVGGAQTPAPFPAAAVTPGGEDDLPEAELIPMEVPAEPAPAPIPLARTPTYLVIEQPRTAPPAPEPVEEELPTIELEAAEVEPEPVRVDELARRRAQEQERRAREEAEEETAPIGFAEAQKALATITDRDDIARIVLRFAAGKFSRVLLLHIQRDMAVGWHGAGAGLEKHAARRVFVSLRKASPFKLVRDSRSHFLGPLRRDAATVGFLQALGAGEPRSAVLMPILAAGRVVNVLYCDNGAGQFASPDVGELLILAQKVGRSYEAMIAARKARARTGA